MILKINTDGTKNFNAGAIIATAKRQFLAQKSTPYNVYRSLILVHLFFTQLTPFADSQNPMFDNAFQSISHPKSASSREASIYIPV